MLVAAIQRCNYVVDLVGRGGGGGGGSLLFMWFVCSISQP